MKKILSLLILTCSLFSTPLALCMQEEEGELIEVIGMEEIENIEDQTENPVFISEVLYYVLLASEYPDTLCKLAALPIATIGVMPAIFKSIFYNIPTLIKNIKKNPGSFIILFLLLTGNVIIRGINNSDYTIVNPVQDMHTYPMYKSAKIFCNIGYAYDIQCGIKADGKVLARANMDLEGNMFCLPEDCWMEQNNQTAPRVQCNPNCTEDAYFKFLEDIDKTDKKAKKLAPIIQEFFKNIPQLTEKDFVEEKDAAFWYKVYGAGYKFWEGTSDRNASVALTPKTFPLTYKLLQQFAQSVGVTNMPRILIHYTKKHHPLNTTISNFGEHAESPYIIMNTMHIPSTIILSPESFVLTSTHELKHKNEPVNEHTLKKQCLNTEILAHIAGAINQVEYTGTTYLIKHNFQFHGKNRYTTFIKKISRKQSFPIDCTKHKPKDHSHLDLEVRALMIIPTKYSVLKNYFLSFLHNKK